MTDKKSLNDRLIKIMENKIKDAEKNKSLPTPDDAIPTTLPKEKQEGDCELLYVKDGEIKQTTLYTTNKQEFIDWIAFTHPLLMGYPDDLKTLVSNPNLRKQLLAIMQNGIAMGRQFRDPRAGLPALNTYKGKGH